MAENSKIEWTHHTFNPWRGCTKVAPECANCYAETLSKRNPGTLGVWGPQGRRVVAAESYWRQPLKWDREAAAAGDRRRVFCASLADVFEDWPGELLDANGDPLFEPTGNITRIRPMTLDDVRRRLFALIDATPNLDWLLLTKRPENIRRMWPTERIVDVAASYGGGRAACADLKLRRDNVWLGVSCGHPDSIHRVATLAECCDLAPVRFVSAEPMLGPVDFRSAGCFCTRCGGAGSFLGPFGESMVACDHQHFPGAEGPINWLICGGESGPKARPMDLQWVESIADQCAAAGVPLFVKQDSGPRSGMRGRLSDALWGRKEFPTTTEVTT